MTRVSCPSALGLMDNAQDIVLIRDFRKCEKYLTLPSHFFSPIRESPPGRYYQFKNSSRAAHEGIFSDFPKGGQSRTIVRELRILNSRPEPEIIFFVSCRKSHK